MMQTFDRGVQSTKNRVQAFTELYNKLSGQMYYFAWKLLDNEEEAQDIVHDVFHRLWSDEARFDSIDNAGAYIRQMTRNACFNAIRRSKIKAQAEKELLINQEEYTNEVFVQAQIRADMYEFLTSEVKNLPPKYQRVFTLSFLEGLNNDEVAAEMQMSNRQVSDIKFLLRKALKVSTLAPATVILLFNFLIRK